MHFSIQTVTAAYKETIVIVAFHVYCIAHSPKDDPQTTYLLPDTYTTGHSIRPLICLEITHCFE